ncbi:hypothetical protein PPERSA_02392 [Pseudocohnilembus persalinus]|uniref:Uncharacterized protein n=1 Tax=Pseudocohnilembus persalinus TaxID=266149 RepID=A0A0V0QBC8_PSEPJ|nr:hypothetical protein PPERSA_02392 [Pseudocohnilembus persalinus]|eukprot:KRW99534.1 hypothetical protein PPERSA_02392 [Pseudocohnilembus persalinus]
MKEEINLNDQQLFQIVLNLIKISCFIDTELLDLVDFLTHTIYKKIQKNQELTFSDQKLKNQNRDKNNQIFQQFLINQAISEFQELELQEKFLYESQTNKNPENLSQKYSQILKNGPTKLKNAKLKGILLTYLLLKLIDSLNLWDNLNFQQIYYPENPQQPKQNSVLNILYQLPIQKYYLYLKKKQNNSKNFTHLYERIAKKIMKSFPVLEYPYLQFFLQNQLPIIHKSQPQSQPQPQPQSQPLNFSQIFSQPQPDKNCFHLNLLQNFHNNYLITANNFVLSLVQKSLTHKQNLNLLDGIFLDPLAVLLIKKNFFKKSPQSQLIIIYSLIILIVHWDLFIAFKRTTEQKIKRQFLIQYKINLLKALITLLTPQNDISSDLKPQEKQIIEQRDKIITFFIHSYCIQDEELIRQIVYSGFPIKYLEKMVKNVDFLHLGLSYVKEFIPQQEEQNHNKIIYQISYLTTLITHYKNQNSLFVAQEILNYIHKILALKQPLSIKICNLYFQTLSKIGEIYPNLHTEINQIRAALSSEFGIDQKSNFLQN